MRGFSKTILLGTLGKDPETKTFPNGGSTTTFSIATSRAWTDRNTGELKEKTEWHRIVLHNRLGQVAQQYLRKGSKVFIEGYNNTRQWQDQNDQTRYTVEVIGESMQLLDSANLGVQPSDFYDSESFNGQPSVNPSRPKKRQANNVTNPAVGTIDLDDDLPF